VNDEKILHELTIAIKDDIHKFESRSKKTSKLMKFLNFFIQIFNKDFMERYSTTIYPNVYFPDNFSTNMRWEILAHEWVHLRGGKKSQFLFSLKYLFPQWLVVLSFLSFLAIPFSNFWLLNLLWLVLVAPLPAYWRMQEELDGYTMNLVIDKTTRGAISPFYIDFLELQFTGPGYYFMWPFKKNIANRLSTRVGQVLTGQYDKIYPYSKVREIIILNK